MNPKDQTERSPLTEAGMGADANTADRRKSEPKRPEAASAQETSERNLLEQIVAPARGVPEMRANGIARHYSDDGVAA